jgi:quaternary ammonium compound-resistance protein SugE
MNSSWFYLIIAGFFEIGWPLGFKLSQTTRFRLTFIAVSVVSMAFSGFFLWMAQKEIPIGTAYAVWTGIGAAGTFLIGVAFLAIPQV